MTGNLYVADTVNKCYALDQSQTRECVKRLSEVFTSNKSPAHVLSGVVFWIFSSFGLILFNNAQELQYQTGIARHFLSDLIAA